MIAKPEALEIDHTLVEETQGERDKFFQELIENSLDAIVIMNGDLAIIYESPSTALRGRTKQFMVEVHQARSEKGL